MSQPRPTNPSTASVPPQSWLGPKTITFGGHVHTYYEFGLSDAPRVLLMHEFPGIGEGLYPFADQLAARFRVVVPSILGRDGMPTIGSSLRQLCIRREVRLLFSGSPAIGWLRNLVDDVVAPQGSADPIGVIGLCLTGNFALALAVDPRVRAAVVAEPTMPIWPSALGLSAEERKALQGRNDLCVRGFRFTNDWMSPKAKLESASKLLGDSIIVTPLTPPTEGSHSTLTRVSADLEAVTTVLTFLDERLCDTG